MEDGLDFWQNTAQSNDTWQQLCGCDLCYHAQEQALIQLEVTRWLRATRSAHLRFTTGDSPLQHFFILF